MAKENHIIYVRNVSQRIHCTLKPGFHMICNGLRSQTLISLRHVPDIWKHLKSCLGRSATHDLNDQKS